MDNNKRAKQLPIPDNYKEILTNFQLLAIKHIESFGGELWFIRRPLFQDVVPVVKFTKDENCEVAVIDEDGSLNKEHGLIIREDSVSTTTNITDFVNKHVNLNYS